MKINKSKENKIGQELPALVDMHEAAKSLRICYRSIQTLVYERRIGFVKIGRSYKFRPEDLNDFIKRNYIKPVE
jgi:excisionase family DNA binding protein